MQSTHPDTSDTTAAALATAACGYWHRRGLPTAPGQVVAAPGAPVMLLALLAATGAGGVRGGSGVLLPRPSAAWYAPQARLLGRPLHPVPVPAECGGVPDPFALLETVRRVRAGGGDPRVLLLSVADDPTGTAVPPELLHEVCEAAADEGLLIVSDESWRDTSHDPHDTVIVSPAEMLHSAGTDADWVVVLVGLGAALLPPGLPAGIARFPGTDQGRVLGDAVREVLDTLHTELSHPVAEAAAEALTEPAALREQRAATARTHGAYATALQHAVTEAGALCRPPHAGRQLYADFEPLRSDLAARGIEDAATLEAELVVRLGPFVMGGHRFGDDPHALRVRLSTEVLARGAPTPPEGSGVLDGVRSALTELTATH
ncbi:aminotransferase class I/II-fold pyridoxal phosphate-dependent enzyme [Streptomyces gobiensis]|uniref:aminotransferase class I/II-fold pyridoxal phosphate-dependent enzyme n=1 Tax=Streptomyces gobiensis TaxID=2875706 RepID=UPI001E5F5F55|nr:aminotransferase class I/II-fold pyridoxal phosphate-dependent enzyme [Streptomyces gobiensis]UGY94393.1 aminotransferase class I/II-fold pyridoxal phosphate-dependent enzyme [Streptomyces gobiensis]